MYYRGIMYIYDFPLLKGEKDKAIKNFNHVKIIQTLKSESQNFLDPGLSKTQSWLFLGFRNRDLG